MDEEKIELARRCLDAVNRKDADAYIACCTEDFELVPATAAIEGSYRGAEGVRRFFSDVLDAAPDFRLEIERVQPVNEDRLIAFERGGASGRSSGVSLEGGLSFAVVYDFRGDAIERIRVFADPAEALAAAEA